MKKLKSRLANVEGAEMLSREQLKTVMGGKPIEGSCPVGEFYVWCQSVVRIPNGCGFGCDTYMNQCWQGCVSVLQPGCSTTQTLCVPGTS